MKVVFVSGTFNVFHTGHARLLKFAKECGDKLVVGVLSDEIAGRGSFVDLNQRLEGLKQNILIDEVLVVDIPLKSFLSILKPDIIVKGREHELTSQEEIEVTRKYGGKLIFSSGEASFSFTNIYINSSKNQFKTPTSYINRNNINKQNLRKIINNFSKLRILVLGDLIIDEYIDCEPLGMSREDPTIVVTPIDSKMFLGGAGIVAAHAASLGASVEFISVSGDDETSDEAQKMLRNYNVNSSLIKDFTRPTTLKKRYKADGKTLLRVSKLYQEPISTEIQSFFFDKVLSTIDNVNLVIFSDFNYGCLPQELIDKIIDLCLSKKIFMAADSQSSSQLGDISRFKNMDFITATEHEVRIALHNNSDGLIIISEALMSKSNTNNFILKLGKQGVLISSKSDSLSTVQTDGLEALNNFPVDVSGAGDSMLTASSMALCSGGNITESALIGSYAAAIQVSRNGNVPIDLNELTKATLA